MSLVSEIAAIISAIAPDATHILASKFRADLDSFHIEPEDLPLIVLDNELPKNAEIQKNANILKDTRVMIYFLDQDTPDNTDTQTNTIQASMEVLADRAAFNIYQLDEIRNLGNQKYKINPVFHVYNTDLSGIILEINANENVIISCES